VPNCVIAPIFVQIAQTAAEIWFNKAAVRHLGFFKSSKFQPLVLFGEPICDIMSNIAPIGQTVAEILQFLALQDGDRSSGYFKF